MFGFEKLDAWKYAIDFADSVYDTTTKYPDDERFGLTSQTRRSAVSISANVAEGSGRGSKDFARFLGIAYGSLMETVSHLVIARRRHLLDEATYQDLYASADQLARILSGLRNSLTRE
jgi:four helix bundle protein